MLAAKFIATGNNTFTGLAPVKFTSHLRERHSDTMAKLSATWKKTGADGLRPCKDLTTRNPAIRRSVPYINALIFTGSRLGINRNTLINECQQLVIGKGGKNGRGWIKNTFVASP
ncbi:hypothetical protein [Sphingomonas glacialis]|uniref:hypothetical protein n=1 Tax=Sphingomonas glacialis TaxID=658225 RepID=UPI00112DEFC3|nr:hypothetical protein [Sphingomonas glacialis]